MKKYVFLYLLIIIGFFIDLPFLGSIGQLLFKVFILLLISWFLFEIWKDREMSNVEADETSFLTEKKPQEKLVFENIDGNLAALLKQHQEYLSFLDNQFFIIWNYILPRNGYLFMQDSTSGVLQLIKKNLVPDIHFIEDSSPEAIISLIGDDAQILIENQIEAAGNLVRFYNDDEYRPGSILALRTNLAAPGDLYWLFDHDSPDYFNHEDTAVLERINSSIQLVLQAALKSEKVSDISTRARLNFELASKLNSASSLNMCIDLFADFIITEFEASKLTIATEKLVESGPRRTGIVLKSIGIDDGIKNGFEFPLDEGLNGWVIMKNKPYLLDDIDKGEYFIPRFSRSEKSNFSLRSFLSVPIQLDENAIGMITLEDKQKNKYITEDKERLMEFSAILSKAVQRFLIEDEKIGG